MTSAFTPRDLWLLPLISLGTLLIMLAGAEGAARLLWPQYMVNPCRQPDEALGFRYRPNCTARMKGVEGPWYSSDYNACGYRSAAPCGAIPAGTRRVALLGSSISEGYMVEYPHTIGARLGAELTAMCGAPVEIQNLGGTGYTGRRDVLRMEEALRLKPDAVLLVVLPVEVHDQVRESEAPASAPADEPAGRGAGPDFRQQLISWSRNSRAIYIAQHFLYQNPAVYVPLILQSRDNTDFLRPPLSASWQSRLSIFEELIGELADRARAAGVPFMLAFVPNQVQAILQAASPPPPAIDTEALPRALAAIAGRHGVSFTDTLPEIASVPKPGLLYYQVDGHPSGKAQPVIARSIAQRFASLKTGPFADCRSAAWHEGAAP